MKKTVCAALAAALMVTFAGCDIIVDENSYNYESSVVVLDDAMTDNGDVFGESSEESSKAAVITLDKAKSFMPDGYKPVNKDAVWGIEYNGYHAEILGYEYTDKWSDIYGYGSDPAAVIRYYYQNDNADPQCAFETLSFQGFQDGKELSMISLNDGGEECDNATRHIKVGAGLPVKLVYKTESDSDVELWLYSEGRVLGKFILKHPVNPSDPASSEKGSS